MKTLLAVLLISTSALAADLAGRWVNTADGTVINFLRIGNEYRQTNSSPVTDQWGRLLYRIDQQLTMTSSDSDKMEGKISFYDSRGCSFLDLPVIAEFHGQFAVNFLVTVPRYRFQTITETSGPYSRPTSVRTNCQLLEYVQTPVELNRY